MKTIINYLPLILAAAVAQPAHAAELNSKSLLLSAGAVAAVIAIQKNINSQVTPTDHSGTEASVSTGVSITLPPAAVAVSAAAATVVASPMLGIAASAGVGAGAISDGAGASTAAGAGAGVSAHSAAAHEITADNVPTSVMYKGNILASLDETTNIGFVNKPKGRGLYKSKNEAGDQHLQDVIDYYKYGHYMRDVEAIAYQFKKHIDSLGDISKDSLVIAADFHDTCVVMQNNIDWQMHSTEYIGSFMPCIHHAGGRVEQLQKNSPLLPVIDALKYAQTKGIRIAFLCGSADTHWTDSAAEEAFTKILTDSGLNPKLFTFKISRAKAKARETLAKTNTIIASIGDRPTDFEGGNTGTIFKLPNLLY